MSRTIFLDESGAAFIDKQHSIPRTCGVREEHRYVDYNGMGLMYDAYLETYVCSFGHIVDLEAEDNKIVDDGYFERLRMETEEKNRVASLDYEDYQKEKEEEYTAKEIQS